MSDKTTTVDVQTSAAVHVPAKAREIISIVRMVVTETMGLKLDGEPQIHIRTGRYKEVSVGTPPPTAPAAPVLEEE